MKNDKLEQLDNNIYKAAGGLWFRTIVYTEDRIGESLKLALLGLKLDYLREMKSFLARHL